MEASGQENSLLKDIQSRHATLPTGGSPCPPQEARRALDARASSLPGLRGRSQSHGGLAGEQEESEGLLQIQANRGIGMVEIADGDVLADVKIEIAAAGSQHERPHDGWRPDDLVVDKALDVLKDGVSMVAGLGERRGGRPA